jgi:hypothetical protein
MLRNIIHHLIANPRQMFFIDGIGALLTAVLLTVLLGNLPEYFGVPVSILTYLSLTAVLFCVYSFTCCLLVRKHFAPFIRAIGISNLLYCLATATILLVNYSVITPLGIVYFTGEISIICVLVYIEFAVASNINKTRS